MVKNHINMNYFLLPLQIPSALPRLFKLCMVFIYQSSGKYKYEIAGNELTLTQWFVDSFFSAVNSPLSPKGKIRGDQKWEQKALKTP